MGRYAEAREYCEKSVALARKMSASDPQDQTARFDLGMSVGQLGMVEPDDAHLADSLRSIEESLAILEPVRKANPTSVVITNRVALLRQYAGYRLRRMGRINEAGEQFREALANLEALLNAPNPTVISNPGALDSEEGLAEIYAVQGDRDKALEHAQHAVARAEQYSAANQNKEVPRGHLANAYGELAIVKQAVGDREGAAAAATYALSIWSAISNEGILSVHRDGRARVQELLREIAK
jgi:tetratricopeptide (TPR) repeat protein